MNLPEYFDVLCRVESGKPPHEADGNTPLGDNGAAKGPLQIHPGFWVDAVEYYNRKAGKGWLEPGIKFSLMQGRDIHGITKQCEYEDLEYFWPSVMTSLLYYARFALQALEADDWQTLARIHNGGPDGADQAATEPYWCKFQDIATDLGYDIEKEGKR